MIYRLFGLGLDVGRSYATRRNCDGGVHADTHETILSDRFGSAADWLRSESYGRWHRSSSIAKGFAPTDDRADVALCKA
jgi:hypothetical protein